MKLSGRETFMLVALLSVVLIAGYWFLLLSPIQDKMNANLLEYSQLEDKYNADASIAGNVEGLQTALTTLKSDISAIEVKLLPELDSEVIVEHFATIFKDNGLPFTTNISCAKPALEQVLLQDGTFSPNNVQWITVNLEVSGTDGVTPGGIPQVGYNEFIDAIKAIEAENPNAIQVSSIAMRETQEGFQYFTVSIRVFAFNLPNRISTIDPTEKYITWSRDPVVEGGLFGIPYASIPPSQIPAGFFRPFSTVTLPPATDATAATPTPAA